MLAIVLLVVAVIGIASFARRTFSGGDAEATEDNVTVSLTDFENTSSRLRLTLDGPVVSAEEHRAIRISVSASERVIEILRGYDGAAISRKAYPNTIAAYQTFVRAVNFEGFASRQENKLGDDERGICPEGKRTITELFEQEIVRLRLWAVTCDKDFGTLSGDARGLVSLFQDQIPDYRELTRGIRL